MGTEVGELVGSCREVSMVVGGSELAKRWKSRWDGTKAETVQAGLEVPRGRLRAQLLDGLVVLSTRLGANVER